MAATHQSSLAANSFTAKTLAQIPGQSRKWQNSHFCPKNSVEICPQLCRILPHVESKAQATQDPDGFITAAQKIPFRLRPGWPSLRRSGTGDCFDHEVFDQFPISQIRRGRNKFLERGHFGFFKRRGDQDHTDIYCGLRRRFRPNQPVGNKQSPICQHQCCFC